ncbi:MAG TPA: hypothetical protein VKD90_04965, partial [Gemmataceae bacterium]|nr:hypothetical protein [Gemmataceae bacterium]
DPAAADGHDGLGLVSMRERLYMVGGRMVIHSRPGGGTRIDVRVPLGERPAAEAEVDLVTAVPAGDTVL